MATNSKSYQDEFRRVTMCVMSETRNENEKVMVPLKFQFVRWSPQPEGFIEPISSWLDYKDDTGNRQILNDKTSEIPLIEKIEIMPSNVINEVHQFD